MIKGVVMDDERLKNPNYIFGEDYFEETLERIRNIRATETKEHFEKIIEQRGIKEKFLKQIFMIIR